MGANPDSRRTLLGLFAGARVATGALVFAAPRAGARAWIGSDGEARTVRIITRSFAGRDLAIGLGTLRALRAGDPTAGWFQAALLADLGDLVTALRSPRSTRKLVLTMLAASGVAGDVAGLLWLQPPRPDASAEPTEPPEPAPAT